ncbi:MAG: IPT/TIG domain-containing protein, partial [Actinomycetota bacterium]|nr:IPT/TIG domain-containing protein [Actinomycetota bacterium]
MTALQDGRALAAGGETASAELYNPGSGTWSPTTPLSESRRDHAAVRLNDGKVLVTGGFGTALPLRSAEIYDPGEGTWSSCSASGTPGAGCPGAMTAARFGHTATLLNDGRVLLVGGSAEGTPAAEVYDPATGRFSPVSGGQRRTEHEATRLGDGKVLITGGNTTEGITASAEIYDPSTNILSPTGALATRRAYHTATLLGNGKVLVAGGGDTPGGGGARSSAELYSPNTGTWSATGSPMKDGRFEHTATRLANGTVLLAGGFGPTVEGEQRLASSELYDPATNSFTRTDSLHEARYQHEAALLGGGKVLVAGGAPTAELFDPAATLPAPTVSAVEPRRGRAAGGTRVVITGSGFRGASEVLFGPRAASSFIVNSSTQITARAPGGTQGTVHVRVENSGGPSPVSPADEFTFVATAGGAWAFTGFMRDGRLSHTMTLLRSGKVLATGSQLDAGPNDSRSSTETYDPLTKTWTARTPMRFPREEHTA